MTVMVFVNREYIQEEQFLVGLRQSTLLCRSVET